jgi:hypothetical protein
MDDYFYPYPDKHNNDFHDRRAYANDMVTIYLKQIGVEAIAIVL